MVAFERINEWDVLVFASYAEMDAYTSALKEGAPSLRIWGPWSAPVWGCMCQVSFADAPDLRQALPPIGSVYGDQTVRDLVGLPISQRYGVV